jgi:hypothetical protein
LSTAQVGTVRTALPSPGWASSGRDIKKTFPMPHTDEWKQIVQEIQKLILIDRELMMLESLRLSYKSREGERE